MVKVRGNGKGKVVLTGTVSQVNNALEALRYKPKKGFHGTANLKILTQELDPRGQGGAKRVTSAVTISVL